ncbi:hypothetical protein AKH00_12075 [Microbacterium sp. GCS4]|nr:hypothetical protein AKH00_12075 [Microbacterium sp. GCS4]
MFCVGACVVCTLLVLIRERCVGTTTRGGCSVMTMPSCVMPTFTFVAPRFTNCTVLPLPAPMRAERKLFGRLNSTRTAAVAAFTALTE